MLDDLNKSERHLFDQFASSQRFNLREEQKDVPQGLAMQNRLRKKKKVKKYKDHIGDMFNEEVKEVKD